jgi:hypothetical protein
VGRTYKEKFEKKEGEVTEKDDTIAKLEAELKKARETSAQSQVATPTSTGAATTGEAAGSTNDEKLAEAEALVSSSCIICSLHSEYDQIWTGFTC